MQEVAVWIPFWLLSERNDVWNWAFVAWSVCIHVLVCLGFFHWSWRCDSKKPGIAFICPSSLCKCLCPAEESLTSFRKRLEMRVFDRKLYSDSDFLASGETEEQKAICYIKYLNFCFLFGLLCENVKLLCSLAASLATNLSVE